MPTPMQLESLTVSDGVSYYYFDSGDVPGNTYTTMVFVPGMGFNGGVFRKLFPLAAAHRLRIVSLYRRDYNPTTSFRDADLAGLASRTVEGQEGFLRSQAIDIATFLIMFAREQHIPPAKDASGGIALLGWSLGSLHIHAVMAHLDALPFDVLSDLEKYLHTVICHDVSGVFIGIPHPPSFSMEYWFETDAEKKLKLFHAWVAGHFLHKNITSGSIDDLEFYKSLDKPHSMHELSPGELAELTSAKTFSTSDTLLVSIQLDVFRAMTRRAIFDMALAEKFLPKLRVRYMCGGASPGTIVWTFNKLRECLADPKPIYGPDAKKARDVKLKLQTEGNHFIFWDEPEVALEQYIATINL